MLPTGLLYGQWCKKDSKLCEHILKSIEKYTSNIWVLPKGLRIEHIMPNTLTQPWKNDLGPQWADIHSKYVNTLGNVTLVEYDKKQSRNTFLYKKKMEGGFDKSVLFLNKCLHNIDVWNEAHILDRAKLLTTRFIKIWSIKNNVTQPTPILPNPNSIVLNNPNISAVIKNRKPVSIELWGQPIYKLDSWRSLYTEIIKQLYSQLAFKRQNANSI